MTSARKANITSDIADPLSKPQSQPKRGRLTLKLNTQNLVEDSSKLVDIAPQTGVIQSGYAATEHAIPDSRQHVSALSNSQSMRKQPLVQHKARKPESTMDVESQSTEKVRASGGRIYPSKLHNNAQNNSPGLRSTNKGSGSNNPKTSRRMQQPAMSSRPKRNSKALHTLELQTEVDWDEDLRPTPNESLKNDDDARGTTVSAPSPGSLSVLDKTSNQKRKRPKSRLNSEKRKKSGKEEAIGANVKDQQSPQLLLTDDPGLLPAYQMASYLKSDLVSHDGPSGSPNRKSGQVKAGSSKSPEVVVEIPSRASPSTSFYTSDDDLEKPPSQRQPKTIASHDGRGKAVGQKLFDALQAVELHSQPMSALETKNHHRKAEVATDRENSSIKIHHARVQSAQASNREVSIPKLGPEKAQSNLPSGQKPTVQDRCQPGSYVQPPPTERSASKEIETKSHKIYREFRRVPGSRQATGSDTNQPLNELTASDKNRQLHVSEPSVVKPSPRLHVHGSSLQTAIEILESQNNASSLSSAETGNISLAEWLPGDQGNEQTPESQRPLLTNKKPLLRSVSRMGTLKSAPINSIVDRNGSPRLATQSNTHMNVLQGSTDTSASVDHQNSSGSSLGSSSEDRRTWTKFQRDMFQEYGITAQELANAPNRLDLVWDNEQAQTTSTNTFLARDPQESWVAPATMAPPQVNGNRVTEKSASYINEEISLEGVADHFLEGKVQDPVAAEISSAGQPMREPSRGTSDPMEWISALQAAQRSAHHLLQDTNQVSLFLMLWKYANYIELIEPAGRGAGNGSSGAPNLPTRM